MPTATFAQSGAIDLVGIAADLSSAIPVPYAPDFSLDNFLIRMPLNVVHVDDIIYDRLVDDGRVADRSGAVIGAAPTRAVAHVVARQVIRQEVSGRDDRPVVTGDTPNRDVYAETATIVGWRERRPGEVFVRFSPRHPGWSPAVTWNPKPADATGEAPASVMIGCPPKRLVGHPCPAVIGIDPASSRVRSPPGLDPGWDPNVLSLRPRPGTIRRQAVVKDAVIYPIFPTCVANPILVVVKRFVLVIGIPIGGYIESDDLKPEIRGVVAEKIVFAIVVTGQIDRAHPTASVFENRVTPSIIFKTAEDSDRSIAGHRHEHGILCSRTSAQIYIRDGVAVWLFLSRRRRHQHADENE